MENLFKDYAFINNMDEDLENLLFEFITALNEKIYQNLTENYPAYRELIHKRSELAEEFFKDRLEENAKYSTVIANFWLSNITDDRGRSSLQCVLTHSICRTHVI